MADFVENFPELFRPQQDQSFISWLEIVIPWIFFILRWLFRVCLNFSIFQLRFGRKKSLTVASGEGTLFPGIFSVSIRLKFPAQLSNQNKILSALPNFQVMPHLRRSLQFSILFQTGEFVLFLL